MVNATDKANALSQQYSSVFTTEDLSHVPRVAGTPVPSIEPLTINLEGVEKLLSNIDPKKASGPDGVPSTILKYLSMELAPIITHIFQQSLDTGDIPPDWLTANITAIFKKGDKSIPANYRPVSLTSVTCKLFEHVLFRHIMSHLEKHNVLSSFQHGFRAQHSCESQLIITVEDLSRNLDNKLQTDVLILDFQKAFDTVPHQRLIQKLDFYGIRGNILTWITKWLTSRTQQVVVDGKSSEPSPVKSGVPQGTVLGPLMFLIHINDISDNLDSSTEIRLFADDCLLYRSISSQEDSQSLQKDLNSLVEWSSKWQMSFNTRKCKTLRVTTKRAPTEYVYKMHNDILENVSHYPYLGVELSNNLKWSHHIHNVTVKANNSLWFIRRNLWRCAKYVKQQMYFALVRPHLEFACAVWDPHNACDISRLEAVQRRAARFVTNNHKRTEGTVTQILQDLQWPSLEQRRKNNRLAILYKIQNDKIAIPIPHYLCRQAVQTRQFHPQRFSIVATHTDSYKFGFIPAQLRTGIH